MGREAGHALGRPGCEASPVIIKIPVDVNYFQWLGEQIGWGAFQLIDRVLLRATGGYESAELVSVLPATKFISYLVFRAKVAPPPLR